MEEYADGEAGLCFCGPHTAGQYDKEIVDIVLEWTRELVATMRSSKDDLDERGVILGRSSYAVVRS